MSDELMLFESGGAMTTSIPTSATYEDLIIGPDGDYERLIITSGQTSLDLEVLEDGELVVLYDAISYNTIISGGAEVLSSGGTAQGSYIASGGRQSIYDDCNAYDTYVAYRGTQWVMGGTAYNTVVEGVQHVSRGGVASNTLVLSGGSQKVYSTSIDTTISYGGVMMIYSGATLGGTTDIAGRVRFITSATATTSGDVIFHLEGRSEDDDAFVEGSLENFVGATGFYVSISNAQADGDYQISEGMSDFTGSITITNIHGDTLGELTLGETLETSYGSYTLSIQQIALNSYQPTVFTDVLVLTVVTNESSIAWPTEWYAAPITVESVAAVSTLNIASTSYLTDGSYAVKVTGGTNGMIYCDSSDGTDCYINVTGGTTTSITGAENCNNYIYIAGGDVSSVVAASGDALGSYITVEAGNISSLLAAGKNASISSSTIIIDAGDDSEHTANIYGGVVADQTVEVSGNINLEIKSGTFYGIVVGGGHLQVGSEDATATVGNININIDNVTFSSNIAFGGNASTDWLLGGVQVMGGSSSISVSASAQDVTINLTNSEVGKVVMGGRAEGENSYSSVNNTTLNISDNITITGDIYGGGYSISGGTTAVLGSSTINIDATDSSISLLGDIYGGGANPYGTGINICNSFYVNISGNSDNLSFYGELDGQGSANNSVGYASLYFDEFSGEFNATISNFDSITFAGDTLITLTTEAFAPDQFVFDFNGRLSSNYENAFASGFGVTDETEFELNFLSTQLRADNSFTLLEIEDDAILGNSVDIYIGDIYYGTLDFGETTLTAGLYGTFSCSIEDDKAVVTFSVLA